MEKTNAPIARLVRMPAPVSMIGRCKALPTVQTATILQLVKSNDITMSESKDAVSFIVHAMVHAVENEETPAMEESPESKSYYANESDVKLNLTDVSNDTMLQSEQSSNDLLLPDNDHATDSAAVSSTPQVYDEVDPQQIPEIDRSSLIEICTCEGTHDIVSPDCWICKRGASKKELIKVCNCSSARLAHLDCLEKQLKDTSIHFCRICRHCLQIKRRDRPFLQWWKHRSGLLRLSCSIISMLIWIIFPYFMVYLFMKDAKCLFQDSSTSIYTKSISPFVIVIWLMGYLYGLYLLIFESSRFWEKWRKSNQDIKLIMYPTESFPEFIPP